MLPGVEMAAAAVGQGPPPPTPTAGVLEDKAEKGSTIEIVLSSRAPSRTLVPHTPFLDPLSV